MDYDAKHLRIMKNIFFLVVIGVLLIGIVSAVAPVTEVSINLNEGLNIDFPKFETIKQGENFSFHFHVFNISDGVRLDNTTVNCSFELYNSGGKEQFEIDDLEYTSGDWRIIMDGNNFTQLGSYAYLVECHTDILGGFISYPFEVSPSGNDAPTDGEGMVFLGSLIAMLTVGGMFLYLSSSFKESPTMRLVFTSLTAIICIIIVLYSTVSLMEIFYGFDKIISSYSTFQWIFLFIVFITVVAVLIAIIFKALDLMNIKRGLKEHD